MELQGDVAHVESRFGTFRDGVTSEIIFAAANGTPMLRGLSGGLFPSF
jgi:hypothetical protein